MLCPCWPFSGSPQVSLNGEPQSTGAAKSGGPKIKIIRRRPVIDNVALAVVRYNETFSQMHFKRLALKKFPVDRYLPDIIQNESLLKQQFFTSMHKTRLNETKSRECLNPHCYPTPRSWINLAVGTTSSSSTPSWSMTISLTIENTKS